MSGIASLADLRALIADLPKGDEAAAAAIGARQARLTKPPGSLGRLEELVAWLGRWRAANPPRLERVDVLVFAGNHGVVARGVSAYPAAVTAQMVANFAAGGAAINQLCGRGRRDASRHPARSRPADRRFHGRAGDGREAISRGGRRPASTAVRPEADLRLSRRNGHRQHHGGRRRSRRRCSAAAARAGPGAAPASTIAGSRASSAVIDAGLARHADALTDPLLVAAALGGRELAAILGATLAARRHRIPGAARRLCLPPRRLRRSHALRADALDHAQAAHVLGRSRPSRAAARSSASGRCSISACGSAKAQARRSRCRCCARRSPAMSAWRPLRRRGSMSGLSGPSRLAETRRGLRAADAAPRGLIPLPAGRVSCHAAWAYPLVGAAVGLIGGVTYWIADGLGSLLRSPPFSRFSP